MSWSTTPFFVVRDNLNDVVVVSSKTAELVAALTNIKEIKTAFESVQTSIPEWITPIAVMTAEGDEITGTAAVFPIPAAAPITVLPGGRISRP